ncbi:Cobalt-precorrin-2 C(20)-methyltransferase [hydrothermal vent metagenome]|uniref:Cobalt-precorrin-2 C(20)-methyltransferase n=1 Tax=hydrothermal vent metagenome TaxID=652676 RepID=A0A3B1AK40_9ZZZZ
MSVTKGTLFGVSLGPGDPDLITRRAWQLLQQDNTWTYPIRNKKSNSYALDIVTRSGLTTAEKNQALIFPMTHDLEILSKYWMLAAQTVIDLINTGEDVLFLVEGDASTYSTFGHLARTVKSLDKSININIIPGVPSFNAAAATLNTPLADVDDTVAIIPAAYGIPVIEKLLLDFDSLVLIKVKPILDDIITLLEKHQLLEHSCFIEKAGAPDERIVTDVKRLIGQKVNYLSLMLVKNPNRTRGELIRGCRKKHGDSTVLSTSAI